MNYAIITGDVINYSRLAEKARERLIAETSALIRSWAEMPSYAAVFRADSFQLMLGNAEEALKRSIQLRCFFKKLHPNSDPDLDAKIAIGIGEVTSIGDSVLNSDGPAFHLSGRNFDEMKMTDERLRIITGNSHTDRHIRAVINLADIFITEWTASQAEVIFLTLEGKKQQEIAQELGIVQSAVSNRLKLSRWDKINETMQYIASLMQ